MANKVEHEVDFELEGNGPGHSLDEPVAEAGVSSLAEDDFDLNKMVLSSPVKFEEETYKEVTLNFDRLTGSAVTKAERLFRLKVMDHNNIQNVILSPTYWQILGSIAAGVPYEVVEAMSMKDSIELVGRLKIFFND